MAPTFDDLTLAEDVVARTLTEAHVFLVKAEQALHQTETALARLRDVVERAEAAAARAGWDGLSAARCEAEEEGR